MLRNAWPGALASLLLLGPNVAVLAEDYAPDGCRASAQDVVTQKWGDVPGPFEGPQGSQPSQAPGREQASAEVAELRCRLGFVMNELEKVKTIFRELEEERKRNAAIAQSNAAMRQKLEAALERQHSEALQQEKQKTSELAQELWVAHQKYEAANQQRTKASGDVASPSLSPAAKPEAIRGKKQLPKQTSDLAPNSDRALSAKETARRVAGERANHAALSTRLQTIKRQEAGSDVGKELRSSNVPVSSSTRLKVTGVHPAHVRAPNSRPAEEAQKERRGREAMRGPKVQYAQSLNRDTRPAGGLRKMVRLVPELPVELRP